MSSKNFSIKSNFLGGSVLLHQNDISSDVEINVKIYGYLDADSVIRAYFASKDTKEIKSIGIIDNFGNLSKKVDKNICTDTIVFILKNTLTDKTETIGYAYNGDEWTLEDESAIENAKKLLDEIKSDCIDKDVDFDSVSENIFREIKENLKNYDLIKSNVLDEFDVYKITDFKPISNISSVKYAMFEKRPIYSFDLFSHYLFGISDKKILLAFASENEINPIIHLNDLCTQFKLDDFTYFCVIIELSDDGQYFIKD